MSEEHKVIAKVMLPLSVELFTAILKGLPKEVWGEPHGDEFWLVVPAEPAGKETSESEMGVMG